jgi:hypothetical protein
MKISIDDQIKCALREFDMRQRVYPGLIKSGKMSVETAGKEMETMLAIAETLKWAKRTAEKMREGK